MLKKVDSSQLKVGMYIHDLSCDWMTHPFVRNRFVIATHDEIAKIIKAGIHDVVIDSEKGLDVEAPTLAEAHAETERELARRWIKGDKRAGEKIVEACLPFVISVALEYRR